MAVGALFIRDNFNHESKVGQYTVLQDGQFAALLYFVPFLAILWILKPQKSQIFAIQHILIELIFHIGGFNHT